MRVKIKQWNTVATWEWKIEQEVICTICQNAFEKPC